MELIKWVLATLLAFTVTFVGIGLAIGAVVFATVLKLIGFFTFVAASLAIAMKEKIDEHSKKGD
jgi:hypothetical protein